VHSFTPGPISDLWSVTCRMRLQSVTCHLTQVNIPTLISAKQASTQFPYHGGMKGWVDWCLDIYTEMVRLSAGSYCSKY